MTNNTFTSVVVATKGNNASTADVFQVEAFMNAYSLSMADISFIHNHGYLKIGECEVLPEMLTGGRYDTITLNYYEVA